jgi:hypothetical protein
MSNSKELLSALAGRAWKLRPIALSIAFAAASITVGAKLVEDEAKPPEAKSPPPANERLAPKPPKGAFQIRCWQYGELLFEEYAQSAPTDLGKGALNLAGKGEQQRLYLVDTQNATCLVKSKTNEEAKPATNKHED